jgi:hypothetical protein
MIKIHLRGGVHRMPSAKRIGAPAHMFTRSGISPYPSSNKPFTGPFSYTTGFQDSAHLVSQCFENTTVTTWLSSYSSEHLCRYWPVALTTGFDGKVEIIRSSSDHCTDLFRTANQDFSWSDTPCR